MTKIEDVETASIDDLILDILSDSEYPVKESDMINQLENMRGASLSKIELKEGIKSLKDRGYDCKEISARNESSWVLVRDIMSDRNSVYTVLGEIETPILLTGDWHVGHRHFSLDSFNKMKNDIDDYNVKDVLVDGDLLQGLGVHRVEKKDLKLTGIEEQIDYLCDLMDDVPNNTNFHATIGNHEEKIKGKHKVGFDPLKAISKRVDNFTYYGAVMSFLLNDDFKMTSMHGGGSVSYADTYPLQKVWRNLPDPRPDVLQIGHIHKLMWDSKPGDKLLLSAGSLQRESCFDEETEILTKNGWLGFNELDNDQEVATRSRAGFLEWQEPTHYFEYDWDDDLISLNGKYIDMLVTQNHNLLTREYPKYTSSNREDYGEETEWGLIDAQTVVDTYSPQKWQLNTEINVKDENVEKKKEYKIPQLTNEHGGHQPKHFGTIDMDLWLQFLGWYLSEGYSYVKGNNVSIAQKTYQDEVTDLLDQLGWNYNIENGKNIRICGKELAQHLHNIAGSVSREKKVPDFVKRLPKEQYSLLLKTYYKGDGHLNGKNQNMRSYSSKLIDDIQALEAKRGTTGIAYPTSIGNRKEQLLPTISQEPRKEEYKGKVRCVEVPNHTLLVRRNGKPIWSGNSYVIWKGHVTEVGWLVLEEYEKGNKLVRERTPDAY